MKPPKLCLLFLLFLLSSDCYGQAGLHTVTGVIVDSVTTKGLEFAAVSISKTDSGSIISSALTDSAGRYTLMNIATGHYVLKASFTGYQKKKIPIEITADKKTVIADKITLTMEGKMLAEATILSDKPVIRFEPGKIVFDVAKTVTDGSESAMESMQKIPGVSVTQTGDVEVKGKGGVKYLVDGKPSPLAQSNPEAFLKSIPAQNIESIEIITTPSAKYDASGNAAVINIHLKKGKLEGLNGSLTFGVGTVFDKYNTSGNINYKKGKINIFANAYFRDEHMRHSSFDNRQVTANDTTAHYNTVSSGENHSRSASGKAGIEYSFDKYNAVTYAIDADMWQYTNAGNDKMAVQDNTTPTLVQRLSQDASKNKEISITNSLNYRKTYDSADRSWTIDLAHTWEHDDDNNQTISRAYDSTGAELSPLDFYNRSHNYGINQNVLLQTDYAAPLKKIKGAKIETGVKEELNLHNSTTDVYSNFANTEQKDTLQSNVFKYTESITAAYGVYSGKFKNLSYSGGLRWEHTYVYSDRAGVDQNYASFFPSGSLGYKFNDKHSLSLSYSRRINRPGFWMLNNSITYSSPYAVSAGNPELKPSFSNSVELGYNGQIGEQNINFSASYSRQTAAFNEINRVDSNKVTHTEFENDGTNDNFYSGVNFSFKFTKWWNMSVWTGYGYHWFAYTENGQEIRNQGGNANVSGNMTFKFWKTASLQFWGWGNSGWVSAQGKDKAVGAMSITLKKKFFKDKFTVALSCRDVFHTQIWASHTFAPGLSDYSSYQSQSTVGYLTLTYQFGTQTFTPETKGKSDRMGGGGGEGK